MKRILLFLMLMFLSLPVFNKAHALTCNYCPPGTYNGITFQTTGSEMSGGWCNFNYPQQFTTDTNTCCAYKIPNTTTIGAVTNIQQQTCTSSTATCDTSSSGIGLGGKGCIVGDTATCSVKIGSGCAKNSNCTQPSSADPSCPTNLKCIDTNGNYYPDDTQWPPTVPVSCGLGTTPMTCTAKEGADCSITGCCIDSWDVCSTTTHTCTATCSNSYNKVDCRTTNNKCCNTNETCDATSGKCSSSTLSPNVTPEMPTFNGGPFSNTTGAYGCGKASNSVWTLNCIFPLFANIIFWLLSFSGVTAVFMIIVGGLMLLMANGEPKNVVNARRTIEFALIGLIIIFLTFFILGFIAKTTGVACLDPNKALSFTSCK